jgi:hypothetical protein
MTVAANPTAMNSALETVHQYYGAFSTLDLSAIVPYFNEPCMLIGPQGVFTAANREGLANAFVPLIEGLKAKGYGRSEFVEAKATQLGETAALVQGTAVRYTAAGPEIERLGICYLMRRAGAGWKIAAMVLQS